MLQEPLPSCIDEDADEMLRSSGTVTLPEVVVRSPPESTRSAVALSMVTLKVEMASEPPEIVMLPALCMSDAKLAVAPEKTKEPNVLSVESIVMVSVPEVNVIAAVPSVNVEPAPEVSQLPAMSQAAVVRVMVPLVPPVMVTFTNRPAEAFAVRMPPLPTVRLGVSPVVPICKSAVASSVVELESEMVIVESQRNDRVAIVKATALPEAELNVSESNSASDRLVPANVMVCDEELSKVVVLVPASQFEVVVLFVHEPPKLHVELPKSK